VEAFQIQRRGSCSIDGRPGTGFVQDWGRLVSSRHYERFMGERSRLSGPANLGWIEQQELAAQGASAAYLLHEADLTPLRSRLRCLLAAGSEPHSLLRESEGCLDV
jgi:hypothetical protein